MKKIAIIGTGYMARIIAIRARELGIEAHCFSNDDCSVAAEVATFHHVDVLDVEKLTRECRRIHVNGVVATTELTIFPANQVASNLGMVCNDVDVAKHITDKAYIRKKTSGIKELSYPQYYVCTDIKDIPDIKEYPVIVKPIAAGGKRGITVVYNKNEVIEAIQEALDVSKIKGTLIEQFLSGGQEYSVESLSYRGKHYIIQVTEKDSSGPPHCVELGHHQPARLSPEMRLQVESVVSQCLMAVGIKNGPCHTEIKIIDGKIYLIEINGRPGGDHIAYPLTELSTGYPYITGIIMVALNEFDEGKLKNIKNRFCGVQFVTTQNSEYKVIFDECDDKPWLYKKNKVSEDLKPIVHNDGFNINYFIYYSEKQRPNFFEGRKL